MRILLTFLALSLPISAQAHLRMVSPTSRYGDIQKNGPCGMVGGTRTANVTVFQPGETVTLVWDEYIDHPSHYRVSFDADGHDDFADPAGIDDITQPANYYPNSAVLMDDIPDSSGVQSVDVTLPNIECENCTLQIIQVMYDKAPPLCSSCVYGDNDIYYQCVDIALRSGAPPQDPPDLPPNTPPGTQEPANVDPSTQPTGLEGGCRVTIGGWGWLSIAALLLRWRRRYFT